jgi:hypothetical protein
VGGETYSYTAIHSHTQGIRMCYKHLIEIL